jgi:uncharacterized protein
VTHDALPPEMVKAILRDCQTIAVVGLSSNPARPSYRVAAYMQQQGKVIIPVNPHETSVLAKPRIHRFRLCLARSIS